ncbi:hypothetical protein RclHR1_06250006 [Rhizophagus clarus]|uniref:Uncharacterized protein n=1 Tax=Rhizophagus clarus TaxID=94130 RepID=A0A2Z6RS16_9GLOM|nr:hypothetical protein RclHR1_06250006 [Rhizophagus clarus]
MILLMQFTSSCKCPPSLYLLVWNDVKKLSDKVLFLSKDFENKEEILKKAESRWTKLKDKLSKKIKLEEFRVSNHIYENSINTSGIPVINERPSFILHSLPDSDNEKGCILKIHYLHYVIRL